MYSVHQSEIVMCTAVCAYRPVRRYLLCWLSLKESLQGPVKISLKFSKSVPEMGFEILHTTLSSLHNPVQAI